MLSQGASKLITDSDGDVRESATCLQFSITKTTTSVHLLVEYLNSHIFCCVQGHDF